jgi:phosphatidylglycerophosphatase A
MRLVALSIATALGIGYVRVAPGTFGSAVGLLLWLALPPTAAAQGIAIVLVSALGVWSGGIAERHFSATDPAPVVIDEVLGMLVTLFLVPVGWAAAIAGFLLFRAFDVFKPYPANRLERLHGGVGVMADDAMAAIYAHLALRLIMASGYLAA